MSIRTVTHACAFIAALALLAGPTHATTRTWIGFQVGIAGGTPPPDFGWRSDPHMVVERDVYVVDDPRCDDDVFRYGGTWWRMRDGWWWRSPSWHGPWRAVDVRRVPRPVLYVPADHWRHHPHGGPPGQVRRSYEGRGGVHGDDRGHGEGRGRRYR